MQTPDSEPDYKSALKALLDELRWRVESYHCDGEDLEGQELAAFEAAVALFPCATIKERK